MILSDKRDALIRIAEALLEREVLDGAEVKPLIDGGAIKPLAEREPKSNDDGRGRSSRPMVRFVFRRSRAAIPFLRK